MGFVGLGGKLPPPGLRNFAVLLEPIAGVEMSIMVEVVVDGRMDGDELLKASHSPESEHRALSPTERQVAVLGPIVEPPPHILFVLVSDDLHGRFV
ncbi:MAG: hypothetical protein DHS20C06_00900 [Hyphobacterium sp.]|nr:MAG: hypothetical protein DHS20C06_00900 [Hyphobacterium sp.]